MDDENCLIMVKGVRLMKTKTILFSLLLSCAIPILCFAQEEKKEYSIERVTGEIDWSKIEAFSIDQVLWTEDFGIRAEGQICYDEENLNIHLRAVEDDIRAVYTEPLSPVYEDSCLEFFFKTVSSDNYFNFEINPNGCLAIEIGPEKSDRVSLVKQDGNEYFDIHTDRTEDGWEVFYRIPKSFIKTFFPDFSFSGEILANAYKCGNNTINKHYLAWNPIHSDSPNFHRPEDFGRMYFVNES